MNSDTEPKITGSTPLITGNDLRKMRSLAKKTTETMAHYASVKTRKTYENWEQNRGFPDANQFAALAINCGFHPGKLMTEFYKRKNRSTKDADVDAINWEECKIR